MLHLFIHGYLKQSKPLKEVRTEQILNKVQFVQLGSGIFSFHRTIAVVHAERQTQLIQLLLTYFHSYLCSCLCRWWQSLVLGPGIGIGDTEKTLSERIH